MNALDLVYLPIAVLSAPFWMRKKRSGWSERFGKITPMLSDRWEPDSSKPTVMLHAVSVGEVNALRALVPELTPRAQVVISTTTDTGLARAQQLFAESCEVVRYPLDCSWMVSRFLDTINPDVVALVELEVWPNFVKACVKRSIPIGLINGRLSARSFKGYAKAKPLLKPTFTRLSFACMQDQDYADRVEHMGVNTPTITGSMKWDAVTLAPDEGEISDKARAIADELGIDRSKPLIVAGSTAPDEEALLHSVCPDGVQLMCAPRKPERFEEAASALPGCTRRSHGHPQPSDRYLLDTIGELSSAYELADLVVIGRSFFDLYGSDILEPAALAKPVIIGPSHSDFSTQIQTLKDVDAIEIVDREKLAQKLEELMSNPDRRAQLGKNAHESVKANQGVSRAHAEIIMKFALRIEITQGSGIS